MYSGYIYITVFLFFNGLFDRFIEEYENGPKHPVRFSKKDGNTVSVENAITIYKQVQLNNLRILLDVSQNEN